MVRLLMLRAFTLVTVIHKVAQQLQSILIFSVKTILDIVHCTSFECCLSNFSSFTLL